MKEKAKYTLKQDRHTKKYGIIDNETKSWWIEPQYDAIQNGFNDISHLAWVKKDGKYGFLSVTHRKEIIPCEYGFPLYFGNDGYAEAWKDYKTGVINLKNEVVIPIIYDELHARYQRVPMPEEEKRLVKMPDGTEQRVGPNCKDVFHGYACFTNEGGQQAYDENMQPCEFGEWEQDALNYEYEWEEPENATHSLQEVEDRIREEYVKWRKMGGGMPRTHACDIDWRT